MKQRGFTLLEVIITLAIFSLLALATYQLLDQVMRSDLRLGLHETQLRELQRAISIFERDLVQARPHALPDDPSHTQAMISLPSSLTLARGGWRNSLDANRSNLLQVSHLWQDGVWLRESKPLSGATSGSEHVQQQQLLQNVELKNLRFYDSNGQAHEFWPASNERLSLPQAVEIELSAPGYPDIRRFILLPGHTDNEEGTDE